MKSQNKITLITPPDFFENESFSVIFINLKETDQDVVSKWLAENPIDIDLNIYFYSSEIDISWLLFAISRSNYRFIDLDSLNTNTETISSYLLGKTNTFYKCSDINKSSVLSYINQNKISDIEKFLKKVFHEQTKTTL